MKLFRSRKWRAALYVWTAMALAASGVVYRNWSPIERYFDRQYLLLKHRAGPNPVSADLAAGRYPAGSSLDALLAAHPTDQVGRAGRYTVVRYSPTYDRNGPPGGAVLVAKDGRLVLAEIGHAGFGRVELFDTMSPADLAEFHSCYALRGQIQHQAWQDAHMAVASPIAVVEPSPAQ